MEATSVRFAAAARVLGRAARRRGLDVPGFRSPPRLDGVDRSLRRARSGQATVSVRLKGRPWPAVLADMIDGVVAANRLAGADADRARTALWAAIEADALTTQAAAASRARHRPAVAAEPDRAAAASHRSGPAGSTVRRFPPRLAGAPQPSGRQAPTSTPPARGGRSGRRGERPLRPVPESDVA